MLLQLGQQDLEVLCLCLGSFGSFGTAAAAAACRAEAGGTGIVRCLGLTMRRDVEVWGEVGGEHIIHVASASADMIL